MTALAPRPRLADASVAVLLDAAVDGDERAWETLCERHLAEVRAVAGARLRDRHAAEDVVQETMLRAWTRLHQVDDPHRLGAWMKAIAANVAVDHVRRQRATAPLEAARHTAAPLPSHDDVVVEREEAAVLHARLAELREQDRQALWQRDGLGVPVTELAEDLGMTPGSVRVLLSRARTRVRDAYGAAVAPVLPLLDRVRSRWAGLGDALPMALAAPAVVVAVVATVGVPAPTVQAPRSPLVPAATVEAAPEPDPEPPAIAATAPSVTPVRATEPASEPTPTGAAPVADEEVEARPIVRVGGTSAGFRDEAPAADEDESADTPTGPVEGLDLYLEETGLGGLEQACGLCD